MVTLKLENSIRRKQEDILSRGRGEIFMAWIIKEPQVVVWVATFYRLVSAQNVHHRVLCVGCKKHNIKGLR